MPELPAEEAARKLDEILGVEKAKEDGWRVVEKVKKTTVDPSAHLPANGVARAAPPPPEFEPDEPLEDELDAPEPEVDMPDDGADEELPENEPPREEVEDEDAPDPPRESAKQVVKEKKRKKPPETPPAPPADAEPRQEPRPRNPKKKRKIAATPQPAPPVVALPPAKTPRPGVGLGRPGRPPGQTTGAPKKKADLKKGAPPLTSEGLGLIMKKAPMTKRWIRNRALLLLGVSAGLRPSELVSVRLEGMNFRSQNLVLAVRSASAEIELFQIPRIGGRLCTVGALARWVVSSGISEGLVFRTIHPGGVVDGDPDAGLEARHVGPIVRSAARLAGLDHPGSYSGLSLRAGYAEAVRRTLTGAVRNVDSMRRNMRPHATD